MSGDISGSLTSTGSFGHIKIPDDGRISIGDGNDLQLYHNGSHSIIRDRGTGNLILRTDVFQVKNSDDTETMVQANADGNVSLYHNNSSKFVTTKGGVSVTGHITASGNISSSASSTGSFGQIEVGGGTFTSASLAEGGVAIKDEGTTILSSAQSINFTGGAVSASVDGTQTNVTIEALATEVFEFGVAVGTSIFGIELVQDSDNSTILASN
jgi:hypothetical protein